MIAKGRFLALLVSVAVILAKDVTATVIQTPNFAQYFASSEYWFIGEVVSGSRSKVDDQYIYGIEEIDGERRGVSICTMEQLTLGAKMLIAVSHSVRGSECGDDSVYYSVYLNGVVMLPVAHSTLGSGSVVMLTESEFGSIGCDVGNIDSNAVPFRRGDLEWPPNYYARRMLSVPVSVVIDCIHSYERGKAD